MGGAWNGWSLYPYWTKHDGVGVGVGLGSGYRHSCKCSGRRSGKRNKGRSRRRVSRVQIFEVTEAEREVLWRRRGSGGHGRRRRGWWGGGAGAGADGRGKDGKKDEEKEKDEKDEGGKSIWDREYGEPLVSTDFTLRVRVNKVSKPSKIKFDNVIQIIEGTF